MSRRLRFSLANVLLVVACLALAIGWWTTADWDRVRILSTPRTPSDSAVRELPITISASEVGDFSAGESWYLSVNSAGQADLVIDSRKKSRVQRFEISGDQLNKLRELLIFQNFFTLQDDYGQSVPDGSTRTMTITIGQESKTVRIRFLMNWLQSEKAKLREPARALVVWDQIRSWFQNPEAVNTRKYDQMVLDAVNGETKSGN